MAAARDQAARIVRAGLDAAEDESVRDTPAALVDRLHVQLTEDNVARRPAETPEDQPVAEPPAVAPVTPAEPATAKPGKRKFVLMGILTLLALAAASYGTYYVLVGCFFVGTDDAYVRANNTTLGARVSGHIAAILPGDNEEVHPGEVVFKIDDGDYRIALDAARTRIATQQATIDRIGRQVTALESAAAQAQAQVASAEAALKRAGLDFDRQQDLSNMGFASKATFEVSEASRDQGVAAVKSAQAAYDAARDNVEVTKAQQAEARAQLAELQTSLAKAERDFDFTSVRAGGRHLLQPHGQHRRLHRGRTTTRQCGAARRCLYRRQFQGDAAQADPCGPAGDDFGGCLWPPCKFAGFVVDSICARGGNSVFTLLPPDNATRQGFTKIVQRLPVRVRVPKDVARQNLLRAGMSVYTTVDTRDGAGDADSDADLDSPIAIHPQ